MHPLSYILTLIPFTSVTGTLCFTFAAVLIILARRIAYVDLPQAKVHIGFTQTKNSDENA